MTEDVHIQNREAFKAKLEELLAAHEGKFALYHEGELVDVFDTPEAAYDAGVGKFGLDPVYVGHVVREPNIESTPALTHGLIRARL